MIAQRPGAGTTIGMNSIKARRLNSPCRATKAPTWVNMCRSIFVRDRIMLFVIHCANHPELAYRGGQGSIVHLEADLLRVIAWANANGRRWAFSLSNAGAFDAQFRSEIGQLDQVNWPAVAATDFRPADVKEGKQAEFLVPSSSPGDWLTGLA